MPDQTQGPGQPAQAQQAQQQQQAQASESTIRRIAHNLHADLQKIPAPHEGAARGLAIGGAVSGLMGMLTAEDIADINGLGADALGHVRAMGADALAVVGSIFQRKLGMFGGLMGGLGQQQAPR